MRGRTRDAIVGIFITLVILILIAGLTWIGGSERFNKGKLLFARFTDVEGLRTGASVSMRGIQIGKVDRLELKRDFVLVGLRIRPDIKILEGSMAQVRAFSYLGGERNIEIIPGNGTPLNPNDTIPGQGEIGIEEMIAKLENLSQTLDFKPLSQSFAELNKTLKFQLSHGMKKVEGSLDNFDQLTNKIDSILTDIKGQGTIGRLVTSDELYQELLKTNRELRGLIKDIKKNPERYFKVKIF